MSAPTLVSGDGGESFDRNTALELRNIELDAQFAATFGHLVVSTTIGWEVAPADMRGVSYAPLGSLLLAQYVQN